MAAFTTLAIAALAGSAGLFGGKKLASKNKPGATTPDATAPTLAPPPSPTPTTQTISENTSTANTVMQRFRKRASAGSSPKAPTSTIAAPAASMEPRTLLGY